MMTLQRPLVFFDLETTSNDVQTARIVQYCFLKLDPNGTRSQIFSKVNPRTLITAGAMNVHGITDEMVRSSPDFPSCAPGIARFIEGCDLAGHNILRFDVPVLQREMNEAMIVFDFRRHHIVDTYNIECRVNPRDLSTVHFNYTGRKLQNAHDAIADTLASEDVLFGQLGRHELPQNIEALALYSNYDRPILDLSGKFTHDADGYIVFNFTDKRGQRAKDHPDLLQWILSKSFPDDVQEIARMVLYEGDPAAANDPKPAHWSEQLTSDLPF